MDKDEYARHRFGVLLVVLSAIAWSSAGFFTRLIALDAWTILFWRGIFGGFFLACYVVWHYRHDTLSVVRSLNGPGWTLVAVVVLAQITFICSMTLTAIANVAIIYATAPFVAAALAWMWLREKLSISTLLASVVALCGVAIMLRGTDIAGGRLGNLLALAMTFAFAAVIVMVRRYRSTPLVLVVCLANLMTAVVTSPLATITALGTEHFFLLALFGLVTFTLGFTLFTIGSRLIPAAQTALIGALDTPLAPLWVWLVFNETPSNDALLGGAIVMTAVVGYIMTQHRRGFGVP